MVTLIAVSTGLALLATLLPFAFRIVSSKARV